jgi:glycosyltransferase involved in cell wall biosynthesis
VANALLRFVRAVVRHEQFDIVHCTGPDVWAPDATTAHVCQAERRLALRTLPHPGPGSPLEALRDLNFWVSVRLTEAVERRIYTSRRTGCVIAVSEKMRQELVRHYGRQAESIEVIPNGVDLEQFHPRNVPRYRARVRAELGVPDHDFLALYLGGDWLRKGVGSLLRALALLALPGAHLAIVGPGGRSGDACLQMARELGIADRVHFHHPTATPERYHAAADVFVHPSFYDSFAMAPLEAMATGIPALVSSQAGLADWIRQGENGLILLNPQDPGELAAHLALLYRDPEARGRLGREARRTAESFDWESVVARTEALYMRLLAGRG